MRAGYISTLDLLLSEIAIVAIVELGLDEREARDSLVEIDPDAFGIEGEGRDEITELRSII